MLSGNGLAYVFDGTVWVPSGVTSSPSQGFQTNNLLNYYQSTLTGLCPGANNFIATVLAVPFLDRNGAGAHLIIDNVSGSTGWRISWNYRNIQCDVFDGGGLLVECNVPAALVDGTRDAGEMRIITLRCRQVGGNTQVSVWVGSAQRALVTSNGSGMTASTGNLELGSGTIFDVVPLNGGIYGFAYYVGTATDDQLRTMTGRCAAQGTIPLDALAWNNVYLGSSFVGVPTVVDPTIGSGTFTKQGSPTGSTAFFSAGAGGNNVISIAGDVGINIDGGTPTSVYGGNFVINGGGP